MTKQVQCTFKTNSDGDKYWSKNGQLHREDGPAIEWADGSQSWFLKGKLTKVYSKPPGGGPFRTTELNWSNWS